MSVTIENVLNEFSSISLDEMKDASLMRRIDTKFIVPKSLLNTTLKGLQAHYKVLEIQGKRLLTYSSLYFDTEHKKFYNDHHNGRTNRTKIRIRNYVETDLFFLEIKQKDGKGRTTKTRIPVLDFEKELSDASLDFINETTSKNFHLSPSLQNNFNRITLVNIENKERITIDLNLSFQSGHSEKTFEDLVIIELKQHRFNRNSPIVKKLKSLRYYPYKISKYCIGMVSLFSNLKYNEFKEKIIKINKLIAA